MTDGKFFEYYKRKLELFEKTGGKCYICGESVDLANVVLDYADRRIAHPQCRSRIKRKALNEYHHKIRLQRIKDATKEPIDRTAI